MDRDKSSFAVNSQRTDFMMQGLWENVIQCGFKYYQTEDSAPA